MDDAFVISTEEDMNNLGKKIGKELVNNKSCLSISGKLGAGKTTLVKGIISSLGVDEVVTSPSYNIVRQYNAGEVEIFHVDCYRLNSFQEFIDLDLPLGEDGNVILVEWGDLLPIKDWDVATNIDIQVEADESRRVVIDP